MAIKSSAVTQKDIALKLGLSIKAVSAGLAGTGRLNPATRRRIRLMAQELGYVPNAAARALVTQRSNFIGVLFPYSNFSFFGNILAGIEEVAGQHNFSLLLESGYQSLDQQSRVISTLQQRGVDGIIIYPQKNFLPCATELRRWRIPVVQVMHSFPEFGTHSVTVDNFLGASQATEYLVRRGCQFLAMLSHDAESPELLERRRGFEQVVARFFPGQEFPIVSLPIDREQARQCSRTLLQNYPATQAIFAASDVAALGAVQAALELRRRVPQDVAVIGFDNLEVAAGQLEHPLTTVDQPKEQIGQLAAEMCLNLISGREVESQVLIPPLIVRQTT